MIATEFYRKIHSTNEECRSSSSSDSNNNNNEMKKKLTEPVLVASSHEAIACDFFFINFTSIFLFVDFVYIHFLQLDGHCTCLPFWCIPQSNELPWILSYIFIVAGRCCRSIVVVFVTTVRHIRCSTTKQAHTYARTHKIKRERQKERTRG